MELSVYFNGKHMTFIVCEIGPRKTGLICRIHFMDGNITGYNRMSRMLS